MFRRLIGQLSEDQSNAFLEQKGVSPKLCARLYEHTNGWLELLDKWCEMYAPGDEKNDRPEKENESGELTEEQLDKLRKWVKGFVENHWHVKLSLAVYLMAGMRRWTKELLECAMPESDAGINDDIEDVIKELSAEGLIAREGDDTYFMCNESIRTILTRNTMLQPQQRESAYRALLGKKTASGAEVAYYLGKKDLWEEKLAKRLEYHARCLANPAKKQAQKPDGAGNNDYWKEFEEEMQSEQQQENQQALYKRIVDLLEKAIDVFDKVGNVKEENVRSRLFAMDKRSRYCYFLDRYDEAFALAEQVSEECEVLKESKGWHWLEKTKEYAQANAARAKEKKDAAAESGEP